MPLVFNGVTIPENVANALTMNGADIHDVYFNGVNVWHQSLCKVCSGWSGNSLADGKYGLDSSGTNWRMRIGTTYGAYITTSNLGIFTGNSSAAGWAFNTSGSLFKLNTSEWITYNPDIKQFSGSTGMIVVDMDQAWLLTSSGLFAFKYNAYKSSIKTGAYISLT